MPAFLMPIRKRVLGAALVATVSVFAPQAVLANNFEFLAAPEIELNIIYRVDKATGEVGACQYGDKEGTIGVTLCYPPGQGANALTPSHYSLVASRHEREAGVFRVDLRSGSMSICYVLKQEVVCTPPAR
ncbi:MAG: hypothetical protein Q8M31_21480 [Beijerinckiaceae bacterium]|nr:hypothetical protein [Beijerinckiaceae bacterium]